MTKEDKIKKILIYIIVPLISVFIMLPLVWTIICSIVPHPYFYITKDFEISFEHYIAIFSGKGDFYNFGKGFLNSMIICFSVSLIVSFITTLSAYAITRFDFPGRIVIPLIVMALSMVPPLNLIGILAKVFAEIGLMDRHLALILPYSAFTVPLALWINITHCAKIPKDIDKAAIIDGASNFKILYKIILPNAIPGILSAFVLTFISSYNDLIFAESLTNNKAITVNYAISRIANLNFSPILAGSVFASLPVIILIVVFQKFIVLPGLATISWTK